MNGYDKAHKPRRMLGYMIPGPTTRHTKYMQCSCGNTTTADDRILDTHNIVCDGRTAKPIKHK